MKPSEKSHNISQSIKEMSSFILSILRYIKILLLYMYFISQYLFYYLVIENNAILKSGNKYFVLDSKSI